MKNFSLIVFVCMPAIVIAMQEEKVQVSSRQSPAESLRNTLLERYSDNLKAYKAYKTALAQEYLCTKYDAASDALRAQFDALLIKAGFESIETIRDEKIKAMGNVTEDLNRTPDEELVRSKIALLRTLVASNNPAALVMIRRLEDELREAPFAFVKTEMAALRQPGSPASKTVNASPPAPQTVNNKGKAYIKTNASRGKGIVMIELDKLQHFGLYWEKYNIDSQVGRSEAHPIESGKEMQILLDLRKALNLLQNHARGILLDYLVDELKVDAFKCAQLIRHADDLKIEVLVEEFTDFFMDLVQEKLQNDDFREVYLLLQSISQEVGLSDRIQKDISARFFSGEKCTQFMSLLHTTLNQWETRAIKSGPCSLLQIQTSPTGFILYDVGEGRVVFSHTGNFSIEGAVFCTMPYVLVWNNSATQLIDMRGTLCQAIPFQSSAVVVSPDKEMVALLGQNARLDESFNTDERLESNLVLWNITGDKRSFHKINGYESGKLRAIFAKDSSAILTAHGNALDFWDLSDTADKNMLATLIQHNEQHAADISFVCATKYGHFVTVDEDGTAIFWSSKGVELTKRNLGGKVVSVDSTGCRFFVAQKGMCGVTSVTLGADGGALEFSNITLLNSEDVISASFSTDSTKLALVRANGHIEIYDVLSYQLITIIKSTPDTRGVLFTGNNQHIVSLGDYYNVWHFFDKRLAYIYDEMTFSDAFLYNYCFEKLVDDPKAVEQISAGLFKRNKAKTILLALAGIDESNDNAASLDQNKPGDSRSPKMKEEWRKDEPSVGKNEASSAQSLFADACARRSEKKYDEAIVLFEKLVALENENDIPVMAWSHLADCYNNVRPKDAKSDTRRRECLERFIELTNPRKQEAQK